LFDQKWISTDKLIRSKICGNLHINTPDICENDGFLGFTGEAVSALNAETHAQEDIWEKFTNRIFIKKKKHI